MKTIEDSTYRLIHDTNGPVASIQAKISLIKIKIQKGTLTNEDVLESLEKIQERLKRMTDAVDVHYKDLRESKLWQEPL